MPDKNAFIDWYVSQTGAKRKDVEKQLKNFPVITGNLRSWFDTWTNMGMPVAEATTKGVVSPEDALYDQSQPPSYAPPEGTEWQWRGETALTDESGNVIGVSEPGWKHVPISETSTDEIDWDSLTDPLSREQFEWSKTKDLWEMQQYENEKYWEQEKLRLEATKSAADMWFSQLTQPMPEPLAEEKAKEAQWQSVYDEIMGTLNQSPELNWIKIAKMQAMKNPYEVPQGAEEAWMKMYVEGTIDQWENAIEKMNENITMATAPEEIQRLRAEVDAVSPYATGIMQAGIDPSDVISSYETQIKELDELASNPNVNLTYADPMWKEKRDQLQGMLDSAKAQKAFMDLQESERMASPQYGSMSVNKNVLETPAWLKPFVKSDTLNLQNLESAATPSMQSWQNLSAQERVGLQGYANETGDNWANLAARMQSMTPQGNLGAPSWSSAFRRV